MMRGGGGSRELAMVGIRNILLRLSFVQRKRGTGLWGEDDYDWSKELFPM